MFREQSYGRRWRHRSQRWRHRYSPIYSLRLISTENTELTAKSRHQIDEASSVCEMHLPL
eukprot:CCRYP_017522-RA/>CCRYP_017522-RA protein AED:0.37 eAED:0.37 QI:1184/0/0.5/1/0/0/2/403/59